MTARKKKRAPAKRQKPPARRAKHADPGADFCAVVAAALKSGKLDSIPDESLRRVLAAAVRAYAAKAERAEDEIPPYDDDAVTATETVVAACALVRAANLNLFDLAMWYRRPLSGRTDMRGNER